MPSAPTSIRRETRTSVNLANGARDAIALTFEALGGTDGLVAWARLNPDKFYLFLWPKLMPKEFKVQAEVATSGTVFNAVQVVDVQTALNTLERMRDASDAHSGRGGSSDQEALVGELPSHETCVSEADGSGTGDQQADSAADATASREDDVLRIDTALPLPHTVPVA